ncbi:ATP-binding protein [Leptothoe sp. PORK10 BA2]|uniref:ATP-binding protein n=1 Tax=Leptothoe sp. PORK10 BA2 TaxID=3110254 RepID=UPI002B1ED516|nr:ATP-binding protein [Leptothoe sp. PORK10 BA2]MEA5463805.1 ATP-binding protein [Leptothoe sp. PORK10 BA2]
MNDALKILLVEDNPADAYLLEKLLSKTPFVELIHVERLDEGIRVLQSVNGNSVESGEKIFDAVLLDLSLPDSKGGLDTVKRMHAADPEMTIVVLTGLDDEEIAIASLREGAQDYLVKGEIQTTLLIRSIHYAIERQQHLDELQHLNAELVRSNEELEQFAHVVSHDLQQPLQVIYGFAKILLMTHQSHPADDPNNQYIEHIVSASQHMSQLIQDLLAYSKVDKSQDSDLHSGEPTDGNQVMAQVLSDLQTMIQECQATITTKELPKLNISKTHLGQLLQNLLTNALKYHPPGQSPQVKVSVERQGKLWRLGIHDNGIGIQPENAEKIFQLFQRLHTKQEYPGTGIGLATCKKIVESYGGRIWIDLETKVGSTFYLTLPAVD